MSIEGFYPTPKNLIDKMLLGINFVYVDSILEPSAGKGDLAEELNKRMRSVHARSHHSNYVADLDTIEINQDLQHVLKGKGYRVIFDDFLRFETYKKYSLIIMNPPFADGDKHLLKALDLIKDGGSIVCILNAETIKNPYSQIRRYLVDKLVSLNADISYLSNEFTQAERKTKVDIALIKVYIPDSKKESIILSELKKAHKVKEYKIEENKEIAENDFIKATVDKFNFEVQAGIQLIRDYKAMKPMLKSRFNGKSDSTILDLTFIGSNRYASLGENEYLGYVREKYWEALFLNPAFTKSFTSNLLEKCRKDVNKLKNYDFNEYNIKSLRLDLTNNYIKSIEETIIQLFEKLTNKYHYYDEMSKNKHLYDGWKTNKAYKINNKVILPLRLYGWIVEDYNSYGYRDAETIADIDKTLHYLSNNNIDNYDVIQVLTEARKINQTKYIKLRYFDITCYKKGTTHITFTDLDLLKKFNYYGSQKKNWLPPTYGKKAYKEMNEEEKKVIDSYEGEESYNETLDNKLYYLGGVTLALTN